MAVVASVWNLVFGLLDPFSVAAVFPWLGRMAELIRQSTSTVAAYLSAILVVLAALNTAIWQHLSGAISTSMTGVLAFDAVVCRTGPGAIAMAWVTFILAVGIVFSLNVEMSYRLNAVSSLGTPSQVSAPTEHTRAEDAGENIDMAEQPPQPTWDQPQMTPNLAWLLYMAGQGVQFERPPRQHNTAAWVHQNGQMQPGYAETIVEEP